MWRSTDCRHRTPRRRTCRASCSSASTWRSNLTVWRVHKGPPSATNGAQFVCAPFFCQPQPDAMPDITSALTIEEFSRKLRAREITALELTDACLKRIGELQPRLNAFIRVMADDARRDAATTDRELAEGHDRGPLHGVPIAIKDLIDIAGVPTTAASRVREGHTAAADAPVIAQLRRAGAILIGKTNLDEFAYGTTSEHSAFGSVRHPLDPARSPGGSSGG